MILYLFTFLAGVATVLSPCVLPVLPIVLSAGVDKQRFRPLIIILGFILSFAFFTLTLTYLVQSLGLSANLLRYAAIALIAFFGLIMLFPSLTERYSKATSFISDYGTKIQSIKTGTGFISSLLLGIALGLVWTPCAGPILAAVTTLVATQSVTYEIVLLTFLYSLGCGIPMLLIAYGGSKILNSVSFFSKNAETIKKVFGILILITALALFFHVEVYLQQAAIRYLPSIQIEDSPEVQKELGRIRPQSPFAALQEEANGILPKLGPAPDFTGISHWINSKPLTMKDLRGKVVLIDFWTYSCINCIRTFPYLKDWYEKYKDHDFVIVGVHTPEFEFEKDISNVEKAAQRFGITYPIAMDNNYKTWRAYANNYWPAHYLIDQSGIVRQVHFGEGKYQETENAIRQLLGMTPLQMKEEIKALRPITPETYLGDKRASEYAMPLKPYQHAEYSYTPPLDDDKVGLTGKWLVTGEKITSEGGSLDLNFLAARVYLVMEAKEPAIVTVFLDGKPLPSEYYTDDNKGSIQVSDARKYDILNLKNDYGRHQLSLKIPKGVSAYAFTFGDSEDRN